MSFRATVSADDLHRLIYNCKQFQVGKGAKAVHLSFGPASLRASIDDDHTYVSDVCPMKRTLEGKSPDFGLSPEVTKVLELDLRSADGDLEISWSPEDGLVVDGAAFSVVASEDVLVDMFDEEAHDVLFGLTFELKDGSLRKLDLIKGGDYPVSLMPVKHNKYGDLLLFKKGPTVRGGVAILDRKILTEGVADTSFLW